MARNPASPGAGASADPLVDSFAMEPHDAATADEWNVPLADPIANRACADGEIRSHLVNGHPGRLWVFSKCDVRGHLEIFSAYRISYGIPRNVSKPSPFYTRR